MSGLLISLGTNDFVHVMAMVFVVSSSLPRILGEEAMIHQHSGNCPVGSSCE